MPYFLTEYSAGGAPHGETIEAEDAAQAEAYARQRGLNERVVSAPSKRPSLPHMLAQHIAVGDWFEAAHAATQLAHIGLRSGALTPHETVGDTGLVHSLLHLHVEDAAGDVVSPTHRKREVERIMTMAKDQERRVPGWPQSYEGHLAGEVVAKAEVSFRPRWRDNPYLKIPAETLASWIRNFG